MQLSARNKLEGKIRKLVAGSINVEVVIALKGGAEIVSIITKASAKTLGLRKGMDVHAVIKASDVMIGAPCGGGDCLCKK